MNVHAFPETPNLRNAPWSAFRDEQPGDTFEETPAEATRAIFLDMVRMTREDARWAFCQGGMTGAELDEVEAWALHWGVSA